MEMEHDMGGARGGLRGFDGAVEEREELGTVPKYSESVSEMMLNNKKERITDIDQLFFISQIGTGLYGNVMLVCHKDDLMHSNE